MYQLVDSRRRKAAIVGNEMLTGLDLVANTNLLKDIKDILSKNLVNPTNFKSPSDKKLTKTWLEAFWLFGN